MKNLKLLPLVNTNITMSEPMMQALTEFEFSFIGSDASETTPAEAIAFLQSEHPELVDDFSSDFLHTANP